MNRFYYLARVPVSDRKGVIKYHNLCFKCSISNGQNFRRCTMKCFGCKGSHHLLLCDKGRVNTSFQSVCHEPNTTPFTNQSPAPNAHTATNMPTNTGVSHVSITQSTESSGTQVLLPLARVPVSDAVVTFDTARTYVTAS